MWAAYRFLSQKDIWIKKLPDKLLKAKIKNVGLMSGGNWLSNGPTVLYLVVLNVWVSL